MGQARVLWAQQPIAKVEALPSTPTPLRESLRTVARARVHAASLGLDVGHHYTSYVQWEEGPILTTVVMTRPGSVEIAPFSYPLVGELPYKGFFSAEAANEMASKARREGFDVCVSGVEAYSTLGWLDDPVTTPMLKRPEGPLVELLVHELVHTNVFVHGDPDFNESVATFIGQEASVDFFEDPVERKRERARIENSRRLAASLLAFRQEVADLYAEDPAPATRSRRRAEREAHYRERLAQFDLLDRDPEIRQRIARTIRLNDACLALHGTYTTDLPKHERVLDALGGDLSQFVAHLQSAAGRENPREAFFATDDLPKGRRSSGGSGE